MNLSGEQCWTSLKKQKKETKKIARNNWGSGKKLHALEMFLRVGISKIHLSFGWIVAELVAPLMNNSIEGEGGYNGHIYPTPTTFILPAMKLCNLL